MKKLFCIIILQLSVTSIFGQDTLLKTAAIKNQFIVHYYPSAHIIGDIALGFEYAGKKRFAHEISLNVKVFPSNFYSCNKGFRTDYLFKYDLVKRKRFRLSADLTMDYMNVYFNDKEVSYFIENDLMQDRELYQIIRQSERRTGFGIGAGTSVNLKIYRHFYLGGDIIFNYISYRRTIEYHERIYYNYWQPNTYPDVPSIETYSRKIVSPIFRLKLSYLL
ncbi:MAG: hypothetical protein K0S32_2109 [Bacteroidetes bacterium]|jgi:hypothetical protein|nr:hypothetical protein [Bacteroidota bacterium]